MFAIDYLCCYFKESFIFMFFPFYSNKEHDILFKKRLFILVLESMAGEGRGRGREFYSRLPIECGIGQEGLSLKTHEIIPRVETKSRTLDELSLPGTPVFF